MSPRQARAEITRQSIIDAAVELFAEVGYGETDMIDIIDRAGSSKGTCYYYFPTKESLASAVVEQARDRFDQAVAEIWSSRSTALRNLISATFYFMTLTESEPLVGVGYQLAQAINQISEVGAETYRDEAKRVAAMISNAIVDGELAPGADPDEVAKTLVAGIAGCRLFADATGDNAFDRLAAFWKMLLAATAPENQLSSLHRAVRSAARKNRATV